MIPVVKYLTARECDLPFDTWRRVDLDCILHDGFFTGGMCLETGKYVLHDNVNCIKYSMDDIEIMGFCNEN